MECGVGKNVERECAWLRREKRETKKRGEEKEKRMRNEDGKEEGAKKFDTGMRTDYFVQQEHLLLLLRSTQNLRNAHAL